MILGDNNGSPERRRVVFAALPKGGGTLGVGGKYSEDMFARAVVGTQVVVERKGVLRVARRGGLGYISRKKKKNQDSNMASSSFTSPQDLQFEKFNSMDIATPSQVRSLATFTSATSDQLSHTFASALSPSPAWLRPSRALPTMSTTESLHKQCRTLESLFDNKLTAYSRLAATITRPGSHDLESTGSLERWQDLEVELEELLQKVRTGLVCAVWLLTVSGGCS